MDAQERESALAPVLDDARRQVAQLESEHGEHEASARHAYVAGDTAEGDAHREKASSLKPALEAAAERLRTLEEASVVVAADRYREHLEGELARVRVAQREAAGEAARRLAEIRPALTVAQRNIRLGQQAEDLANSLAAQAFELEIGLGLRERCRFNPPATAVRVLLESHRYVRELLVLDVS